MYFVGSINLAKYGNGAAGVNRNFLPCVSILCNIGNCIKFLCRSRCVSSSGNNFHVINIISRRRHYIQRTCVDNAGFADSHAVLAQEEQVAADLFILNCVNSTVNINAVIYKVNEVIFVRISIAMGIKIHIGNFPCIKLELIKYVYSCIANNFISPNIGYTINRI